MSENTNVKRRGITLKTPEDARKILRRVIDRAFALNVELESANQISALMNCWLKAWELDKLGAIEKRLEALEQAQQAQKK